jgi:hypothetical protein
MDPSAIFFVLAVLILVGMYLYAPFVGRTRRLGSQQDHLTSSLLAERDRIINALQELDFDFKLGKIPADDYPSQRTELLQKGADVLRQLDALQPSMTTSRPDAQSRLENAVATDAIPEGDGQSALTDDDLESMIAARRKQRKEKSAGFCPRCGQPVLLADRFCPACGKSLS